MIFLISLTTDFGIADFIADFSAPLASETKFSDKYSASFSSLVDVNTSNKIGFFLS